MTVDLMAANSDQMSFKKTVKGVKATFVMNDGQKRVLRETIIKKLAKLQE